MILAPMLHGKHKNDTWKWRKSIKIVNAVLVFCNSGQRNCLSEIWRWKLAVSVLHFLLYVCSETHNCKMSQKSAGPHFENCAFRVGRIAKTEKCKKWSSKISFDKKQPKRSTTKKQASANQRKNSVSLQFYSKNWKALWWLCAAKGALKHKTVEKAICTICENVLPMQHGS